MVIVDENDVSVIVVNVIVVDLDSGEFYILLYKYIIVMKKN